jgi:hypothetical protein
MKLRFQNELIILLLITAVGAVYAVSQTAGKVVFLRDSQVVSANENGSDVKVLVQDKTRKGQPSWSPDGSRIAYLAAGDLTANSKVHGKLVVISAGGEHESDIPVLAAEPDGTIVGGLRFVEESGWYSNNSVYAEGSANPYIAEYRIMDAKSGHVLESYFGYGFATCATKSQVAYVAESRAGHSHGAHIEVNGQSLLAVADQARVQNLHWSRHCDRLAFFQGEGAGMKFVVLHGKQVEANLPLQGAAEKATAITLSDDSFLLTGPSTAVLYDTATQSFLSEPKAIERAKKREESRTELIRKLGGRSADWWEQSSQ